METRLYHQAAVFAMLSSSNCVLVLVIFYNYKNRTPQWRQSFDKSAFKWRKRVGLFKEQIYVLSLFSLHQFSSLKVTLKTDPKLNSIPLNLNHLFWKCILVQLVLKCWQPGPVKSVSNFLRYLVHRQTDRQTDRQTPVIIYTSRTLLAEVKLKRCRSHFCMLKSRVIEICFYGLFYNVCSNIGNESVATRQQGNISWCC